MPRRRSSSKVYGKRRSRHRMPEADKPDFFGLARQAKAYAERVMAQFAGEGPEIREEVEAILYSLHADVEMCAVIDRRVPNRLGQFTDATVRNLNELIPFLHTYDIDDTKPLEDIRDELNHWLQQQGPGKGPALPSR